MSSVTYEEMLREAMVDLSEMQEQDGKCVGHVVGQNKLGDYSYFLSHWSAMYLRYVQIARKLEQCHDQVLQPQKRLDVRILLDSCLGRMLEMKHKIVEFCGEYVNLDEALVDLKLTPESLEIPIPRYFVEERAAELAVRAKLIQSVRANYQSFRSEAEVAAEAAAAAELAAAQGLKEPPMTLDRALEILQCNERGRQGRQRVKFLKSIYEQEQHQAKEFEYGSSMGKDEAARQIQKTIRGFLARKQATQMRRQELEFLGMEASDKVRSNGQRDKLAKARSERKMKQANNFAELQQGAKDMKARIKVQEGGKIMEEMLDEVLLHLANLRLDKADQLPEFPTEEEGGSLALLGRIQAPAAAEAAKAAEEAKAAEATKKAPGKDAKKNDKDVVVLPKLTPSLFWDRFQQGRDRYVNIWHKNFQKSYFENKEFDQKFEKEILRNEILDGPGGTMAELRRCVDQLVMIELTNLRERMERERGGKKKKSKAKKAKAPKKKNVKDPLDGEPMEKHLSKLVCFNLMQQPDSVRLADYVGSHNMMGSIMDEHDRLAIEQQDEVKAKWQTLLNNWNDYVEKSLGMNKETFERVFKDFCEQGEWTFEPSMLQVRQAVAEYCILPLGSQTIHDLAPHHNAVLFFGPAKCGKTMLTNAVCTEAGANLFNLSPSVMSKFEGKTLQKMIQVVFRVARAQAPAVILIDEVEKVFAGKKKGKKDKGPKTGGGVEYKNAAKMKKDLIQQVKELEPTDRVIVIGNSRAPSEADFKELTNFFRGMVCCTYPDYASRMALWREVAKRRGATLADDADYEALAYMSNKYTSGVIVKVIEETLTERRVKRLAQRPLKAEEFLPALSRAQPIYDMEDYRPLRDFVSALPLAMRRVRQDDLKAEEVVDEKKGKPKPKPAAKK